MVTLVVLNDGCEFVNSPVAFTDISVVSDSDGSVITSTPADFTVKLNNAFLKCDGDATGASLYNITNSDDLSFYLYNGSALHTGAFAGSRSDGSRVTLSNGLIIVKSFVGKVQPNTIATSDDILYYSNSSSDRLSSNQNAATVTFALDTDQGNLDPFGAYSYGPSDKRPTSLGALHPGYRYFDTDINTLIVWDGTQWLTLDRTLPIDGFSPFTVFATHDAQFTGVLEFMFTSVDIPINTFHQVDVELAVSGNDANDVASWKLSFGARRQGGAAATVGTVPSPAGEPPTRANTATALSWKATVVLLGNAVTVKGESETNAKWSILYKVLPATQTTPPP
jgi:hypothetical protein